MSKSEPTKNSIGLARAAVRSGAGRLIILGALTAITVLLLAEVGSAASSATAKVIVTLNGLSVKISPKTVSAGSVTFSVLNSGTTAESFKVGVKKTAVLAHGKRATLVMTLKSGASAYYVGTHKVGTIKVTAAAAASGGTAAIAAGKKVFLTAGCTACHTLKAAKSTGTVGPDLDQLKPSEALVVATVTNGFNGPGTAMPSFSGTLSTTQIANVAAFVSASTHG